MNKKIITPIVLVLIATSLYLANSTNISELTNSNGKSTEKETISALTKESIKEDIETLKKIIPSQISDSDFFEQITDFEISNSELVINFDNAQLIENSTTMIHSISECIKSHCDTLPDKDSFFDGSNTFSDKMLAKNLDLLLKIESLTKDDLSKIDFEEVFGSQNSDVHKNAIELYVKYFNNEQEILLLLDQSSNIVDTKKGFFYNSLLKVAPEALKESIAASIKVDIKDSTGLGKVDILESIEFDNFNDDQKSEILRSFCKVVNPPLKKVFESKTKSMGLELKAICI